LVNQQVPPERVGTTNTKRLAAAEYPAVSSSAGAFDRLPKPLHGELDILRVKVSPALDLSLISVFWETPKVFHGLLPGSRSLTGELLANEWILGHSPIIAPNELADN
jgi:hypothetical protein